MRSVEQAVSTASGGRPIRACRDTPGPQRSKAKPRILFIHTGTCYKSPDAFGAHGTPQDFSGGGKDAKVMEHQLALMGRARKLPELHQTA